MPPHFQINEYLCMKEKRNSSFFFLSRFISCLCCNVQFMNLIDVKSLTSISFRLFLTQLFIMWNLFPSEENKFIDWIKFIKMTNTLFKLGHLLLLFKIVTSIFISESIKTFSTFRITFWNSPPKSIWWSKSVWIKGFSFLFQSNWFPFTFLNWNYFEPK
jgi:hypothetical protein